MEFTPILKTLSSLFPPSSGVFPKNNIAQTIMILSPHPDDESIMGSLALRLARENGAHILNVAVTLGSKKERQSERRQELKEATQLLGMKTIELTESWKKKEKELKALIQKHRPSLIIAPHLKDHHPTHIKTGELLIKTLKDLKDVKVLLAWSEFWGQLKQPNIMVEVPSELLELQMRALAMHRGEVARNPYHLRLPAWMMDNVRRGSESIAGKGTEAPQIPFAVLYRLQVFKQGRFTTPKLDAFLGVRSDIGQIFKLILEEASGSRTRVK